MPLIGRLDCWYLLISWWFHIFTDLSIADKCLYSSIVKSKLANETVEKPLVWKMFIKISHNRLKNCQNVVRNTKNQALFSVSVPLFKDYFWKETYSTVSTAGVTGWWVGRGSAVLTEPTSSHTNCLTARRACADSRQSRTRCVGRGMVCISEWRQHHVCLQFFPKTNITMSIKHTRQCTAKWSFRERGFHDPA